MLHSVTSFKLPCHFLMTVCLSGTLAVGHFNPGPFFQVLKHKGITSFRVVNCLLFSLTFELALWCNQKFNFYSWMRNRTSHPLSEHPFAVTFVRHYSGCREESRDP